MAERDDEFRAFLAAWPEYEGTRSIDDLRAREFARLDAGGQVYLDYTGAGLYGESQVRRHADLLLSNVLGNPHSANPTSQMSTDLVESARQHVLRFFNAAPSDYCVIFTANASHALKLIGESYPFASGSRFLLTFDNHNSVNGIREFARTHGADVHYLPVLPPDMRVDDRAVRDAFEQPHGAGHALFAYPARPISRESSTTWSGSPRPRRTVGTCSWTRPRSSRRTGSTCAGGNPTTSSSRSTRSSAIQPESAR